MQDTNEILSPQHVAQMLGVSVQALQRWRMAGVGPRWVKCGPKAVRYKRSAVLDYVASQERQSTREPAAVA